MHKTLDQKIAAIQADPTAREFILADAKDADMAFGLAAPGQSPERHADEAQFRTLDDYRQLIREVTRQGLVDIMLMSGSTNDVLAIGERIFDDSKVTPAIRANDTTDIWLAAGTGRYATQPSRPFRTATIDHAMCGQSDCDPEERSLGADLGLYSITFNNDTLLDRASLEAYNAFRVEAEAKGFRHFLEVFPPNACGDHCPEDLGRFINDHIARTLAGVTREGRPLFLKIPYLGPAAMEAMVRYDSSLIVGIMGGSAGTTFDAFHMLWESKQHGCRAALFGRKINNAEDQLTFVKYLRLLADDQIEPAEAVRGYHADIAKLNRRPHRPLADDLQATAAALSYSGGGGGQRSNPENSGEDRPDFSKMSAAEKLEWNRKRWDRILG